MKAKLFSLLVLLSLQMAQAQWVESSQVLEGSIIDGFFGFEVAMSDNGQFLAVADPLRFGVSDPNPITIYERQNEAWEQINQIFNDGPASEDFGFSLDFSDDGSILAVGNPIPGSTTGHVQIYRNNNGTWEQIGDDILNTTTTNSTTFGREVSISGDGITVAVSGPIINMPSEGEVVVYRNVNDQWEQIGNNLGGDPELDVFFGWDLSINDAGTLLAVGILEAFGGPGGRVEFYEITDTSVNEIGAAISGSIPQSQFGNSVELTGDGSRVIIGASNQNFQPNYAEVYENVNGVWTQVGQQLFDFLESPLEEYGSDVDISSDGLIIAISDAADNSDDLAIIDRGSVYFYTLGDDGDWELINQVIGELGIEELGGSIAMDDSGRIVVAGSVGIGDSNDNFVGGVRTYVNEDIIILSTDDFSNSDVSVFPNPFDSTISVTLPNNELNLSYQIVDINGRVIREAIEVQNQSSFRIHLEETATGIYFLELFDNGNKISTKKIIKN